MNKYNTNIINNWKLFLDDLRNPPDNSYIIARNSDEAIKLIEKNGFPIFISFDHDLGGDDSAMNFLKQMYNMWDENKDVIPDYIVHSANPVGKLNIISFIESWKKSINL